ncbi:MAG: hypothetical protein AAB309_03950 [Deltaproteobacteria bacterium]
MKKNRIGFFAALFFVFFHIHPLSAGDVASLRQTLSFRYFQPLFEAIGYRPLHVHLYDRDTLQPIQNATVLLSEQLDPSLTFSWIKTNADGNASFDGFILPQGSITVTAAHESYSRYTIFLTEADDIRIPLTRLEDDSQKTLVKGTFQEWPEMEDYDGTLHLGFMLPFLDIVTLLNFDTDKFLAPYVKAQVYKETMVPGNFVAPTQEEAVLGIFSVFISKPMYQMPFVKGSRQNLVAITGEVPIEKLSSAIFFKKPVIEILNLISMTKVGMEFNVEIPDQTMHQNLRLSHAMTPTFEVSVENALPDKDLIYISSGAFKDQVESIFPIDFKVKGRDEKNKKVTLKSITRTEALSPFQEGVMVLHADLPKNMDDKKESDWAMSAAVEHPEASEKTVTLNSFLNFMDISYAYDGHYRFSYKYRDPAPSSPIPSSIEPQLNLSFLNIEIKPTKEDKGYKKTWWTVLAPAHIREFTLPELPGGLYELPTLKPKEELNFTMNLFRVAESEQPFNYHSFNEKRLAADLTHFSRNRAKLHPPQP